MQFGKYRFKCTLEREAYFPPYKGSTFRGGFGHALKQVVCTVRHKECAECLLSERCLYSRVFENGPLGKPSPKHIAHPPRPYVIEPPPETKCHYLVGESFDFNLILFGEYNDYLPYFVYAFELMGQKGLGKKIDGRRATYVLSSIESEDRQIYSSQDQRLATDFCSRKITLEEPALPLQTGTLEILLKTPLRLKFENHLQAQLPFSLVVRAMLRRISALFEAYGDGEPELDYRGLVERSKHIEIFSEDLAWYDWQRYSNRQEAKMLMGGMSGSVTYQGCLGEYLPLLELCREFHLGKQTAFGLGNFDFHWSPA